MQHVLNEKNMKYCHWRTSDQGQAAAQHHWQDICTHLCATWGHPWHLWLSPFPSPSECPPWKEDQLSATTWRKQIGQMTCQDNWPAGTKDYCGGQCLGQMMFEVNAINIIARHMWHELQLIDATFVKLIYSHSHGSHNTITKTTPWMIWHMIERWAFPILRPALLHTPKEHLAHVWLVTDTCVHWNYWNARVWMTCQAFMMIWCSALPPLTNPNWVKQTTSSVWTQHSRLKQ